MATPCGDATMAWRRWGAGAPLVLLHGGVGSWRHWARNIDAFARGRCVLAPDTPGLGDSALPARTDTPQDFAAAIADGLARVLPQGVRCDLVGFSFGAMLAGVIAASRPELVASLTLAGAGGLGLPRGPTPLVRVLDKAGDERRQAHRHNLAAQMIADPAAIDDEALAIQEINTRMARMRSVRFAETAALRRALAEVRVPVASIWGERDAVAALNLPERIALVRELHPDSLVESVLGAGHWVMFEAPDAFERFLARALDRQGDGGESSPGAGAAA